MANEAPYQPQPTKPQCTCSYEDSEEMTSHAALCAVSKAAEEMVINSNSGVELLRIAPNGEIFVEGRSMQGVTKGYELMGRALAKFAKDRR